MRRLEELGDIPCLALLGEPGLGKTTALAGLEGSGDLEAPPGSKQLRVDLAQVESDYTLARYVFDSPEFQSWKEGGYRLYLFLDSLDECGLRVRAIARLLEAELDRVDRSRLFLRIACRTGDWPNVLHTGLPQLWGTESYAEYVLTPLRRTDVARAAEEHEVPAEEFLAQVEANAAGALAAKPLTLHFLLEQYRDQGALSPDPVPLYHAGCVRLATESNDSRIAAGARGDLDPAERIAIAERIAAVSIFCNRPVVSDIPTQVEGEVAIADLRGGVEVVDDEELQVTEANVRDVLGTGLFTTRGVGRSTFSHKTYAEFLAAQYLLSRRVAVVQGLQLITDRADEERRVVPQLFEVAAWLAASSREYRSAILELDPIILLRSSIPIHDPEDRAKLVGALLAEFERGSFPEDIDLRMGYDRLSHDGLSGQLHPVIWGGEHNLVARRAAISIAAACELSGLADDLASVALDSDEDHSVRVRAAAAVARLGDGQACERLRPLALTPVSGDPDDELKGAALGAVWPQHATAHEVFGALTRPKKPDLFGTYRSFVTRDLPRELAVADLPTALRWVAGLGRDARRLSWIGRGVPRFVIKGWDHADDAEIRKGLAVACIGILERREPLVERDVVGEKETFSFDNDAKRRELVREVVRARPDPDQAYQLLVSEPPLVVRSDVDWVQAQYKRARGPRHRRTWARLLRQVMDYGRYAHVSFVLERSADAAIADVFDGVLGSIELDSEAAEKARRFHRFEQETESHQPSGPTLEQILDWIRQRLQATATDIGQYPTLDHVLQIEPGAQHYQGAFATRLENLPGWHILPSQLQGQVGDAAERFVLEGDPDPGKWLANVEGYSAEALSGFRAISFLRSKRRETYERNRQKIWSRWAAVLCALPVLSDEGVEDRTRMAVEALEMDPEAFHSAFEERLEAETAGEEGRPSVLAVVRHAWDERLEAVVLDRVDRPNITAQVLVELLRTLLAHGSNAARRRAEELVAGEVLGASTSQSVAAMKALLESPGAAEAWPVVWARAAEDEGFAKELVSYLAFAPQTLSEPGLRDDQLKGLFLWLVKRSPYPDGPEEEEEDESFGSAGPMDLRQQILRVLQRRATASSCAALEDIANAFPEQLWLRWYVNAARTMRRQEEWVTPNPEHLFEILGNNRRRLVRNADELLDLVLDVLRDIERDLHGETPLRHLLWELRDKPKPKSENEISDYVKSELSRRLKDRGVFSNREVEIRPARGGEKGENPDILVEAPARASGARGVDRAAVVVEAKGCWHSELKTAMETQLCDRYLHENETQYGLYFVSWFRCPAWEKSGDYRYRDTPSMDLREAREFFADQASELSRNGRRIEAFVLDARLRN